MTSATVWVIVFGSLFVALYGCMAARMVFNRKGGDDV